MAKITDLTGKPHSGLVQWAVVGIVDDNVDPDELGRIKVKFPTLHEEPLSFWIRQTAPMAGKERGYYSLPEKEDEVMVVFMQGSQDVGVIIGQFWNGVDIPPQECKDQMPKPCDTCTDATWSTDEFTDGSKTLDDNDRRFLKSRSGHLFAFDDTEGKESVQLWDKDHNLSLVFDPNEKRIILANKEMDIHIRTKQDLYLEAGRDIKWRAERDIIGESGRDTIHTVKRHWQVDTTQNTTLTTGQEFKAESTSANLTCKSALTTTCEGSISFLGKGGVDATLQGGALATVKAGIVKIN